MNNLYRKVLWDKTANSIEKNIMLMILLKYEGMSFSGNQAEMAEDFGVSVATLRRALASLKRLGWITSKRIYTAGTHNLRHVDGCLYHITL